MKKLLEFLVLLFLLSVSCLLITGCSKTTSKNVVVNKKITLESMKNEDTTYLDINGTVMSLPFTIKDFFNTFSDFDAFTWDDENDKDKKMDLNEQLPYKTTVKVSVITKAGEEDEQTKLKNTRFYLTARINLAEGDTVGNAIVTSVSYQHTDSCDFGNIKINGIEINKTTVGEVKNFFEETYGKFEISDESIKCDRDSLATKFKKIEYWGIDAYPVIYAGVGFRNALIDSAVIKYVNISYGTNTFIYK